MIYVPTRVALAKDGNFKRVPPRDPKDRQADYLNRFDFHTLFSDVFIQDGRVWMIGPPFLNLEAELRASSFHWNWSDVTEDVLFENFNRMSRASFPVDHDNGHLKIEGPLGLWKLNVDSIVPLCLEGANILVTQQQDNRLEWIAYWAYFNSQINGVDTLIVYDNSSSLYNAELVDQVISRVPGIKNHIVVKWDTPYGATGGPNSVWDSDFGQHISWEHCRRAFSSSAQTVCVIDIDELPISPKGQPLALMLAESQKPALLFKRQPIRQFPNRAQDTNSMRVHDSFSMGETRGAWLAGKYIFSPSLLPDGAQLMVHRISGVDNSAEPEGDIFAGHFDGIRIRWRHGEKQPVPLISDISAITEPVHLVDAFDRAFEELREGWWRLSDELSIFFGEQDLRS
ncbi:hypothetical protein [Corynebacterium sp. p3-SID1056]|uniref:hypothetical protein n=1 Tax=Corynebacterium sp. p3-SID1056 TaxID=2916092 RepID=UPI0021A4FD40|nr:hypothetical protein [Corynebacterium sp. p3-SID1056]MCT2339113.1 hypothetical protein [Corynebacterium sp. p3-SID1056]